LKLSAVLEAAAGVDVNALYWDRALCDFRAYCRMSCRWHHRVSTQRHHDAKAL